MKINRRKLFAIMEVKTKGLLDKNVIIAPIMIILTVLILRVVYRNIIGSDEIPPQLLSVILNLGLSMNITMTGMFVTSAALSQEKEKHTLRTLMTSSVNGMEFFFGSIIPPFWEIMVLNVLLIPLSGLSYASLNIGVYLFATTLASITSCIIGMLLGIFAKDQMSASTLASPFMLVFMMVPTFAGMIPSLEKFSKFLFTGVIADIVNSYASGNDFSLDVLHVVVLVGEILIALGFFLFFYKKNGYEAD